MAKPSLIDLWTVGEQWWSRQEGWQLLASGNDGGKWAICAVGPEWVSGLAPQITPEDDAKMEQYVIDRATCSQRHWLAAKIARLIP